jgi:uncharacterized membrane protein YkvA (DUF1232 family)
LSPFDVVPESFLGIFGFIDDAIRIISILLLIANAYRDGLLRQRSTRGSTHRG